MRLVSARVRRLSAVALCVGSLGLAIVAASPPPAARTTLPAIVFVSRRPIARDPYAGIPGLGPLQRAVATGGKLLVRWPNGRIARLGPTGRFFDVSDPNVSWDGRRVAFAAITHRDSAWRIWVVGADGRGLAPVTRTDRAIDLNTMGAGVDRLRRYDDLDPCWLPDGRICFASTRYPEQSEAGAPSTNLFIVNPDGRNLLRITSERNGGEEPSVDPGSGRIVYARWWTSRFRASDVEPAGITTDPAKALPAERVSLWHALSVQPDGDGIRLAGGYPRVRSETMAYQPLLLGDKTLVGVSADTLSLVPTPGRVRLVVYPGGFAEPISFPNAPAQMCSPAPLPDGRLVVAYDPAGRGDFGLAIVNADGTRLAPLLDLRGTLELDPAVLAPRAFPPVLGYGLGGLPRPLPVRGPQDLGRSADHVRFDCLNVFANGPVDFPIPDAPPPARDLRIRFFASYARPGSVHGDTVVFLRDGEVTRSGAVHEDMTPGDLPMFEQLVDAHGHVIRGVSGPAHVPGFNAGRLGSGTKCVGCHIGHSAIPVAVSYAAGKRFNAAPAAVVRVTSEAEGTGARAVVDRRTRGRAADVAWVARSAKDEAVTLSWAIPLALDSLVVYGIRPDPTEGTDVVVTGCGVTLLRNGREVRRLRIVGALVASGTGLDCRGLVVDSIRLRLIAASGRIGGSTRAGLAEIEARARIPED